MARLIETQLAASWKPDVRQAPPGLLSDVLAGDTCLAQRGDFRIQVVGHQIELVHIIFVRWVDGHLRRRQFEDQPAIMCVNIAELEHVLEQGTVCFRIPGVNDDVSTIDHWDISVRSWVQ